MPVATPPSSLIVDYARVIEFCHRERSRAIMSLRGVIQTRHPDWKEAQVSEVAERVLSREELELLRWGLAPTMTSHGPIDDF